MTTTAVYQNNKQLWLQKIFISQSEKQQEELSYHLPTPTCACQIFQWWICDEYNSCLNIIVFHLDSPG